MKSKHETATPKLQFADWSESFITRVVEYLVAWDPHMDYGSLLLVVPGGRAGRQILARLAQEAATRKCLLNPPEMLTTGALADRLVGPEAGDVSDSEAEAWESGRGRSAPSLVQELA
ncbi:MAG: hypothetical protein WCI73_02995, partial [Phycisphaerae bacterium]